MKNSCKWTNTIGGLLEDEYYETECGNDFIFADGAFEENNFEYCPYCGKKIKKYKIIKGNKNKGERKYE